MRFVLFGKKLVVPSSIRLNELYLCGRVMKGDLSVVLKCLGIIYGRSVKSLNIDKCTKLPKLK